MGGCCASEAQGTQSERLGEVGKREINSKDASVMGMPKSNPAAGRKKKFAKNKPIQMGYWKMRGLAQPIRYLLEYTEHPYEEVVYE